MKLDIIFRPRHLGATCATTGAVRRALDTPGTEVYQVNRDKQVTRVTASCPSLHTRLVLTLAAERQRLARAVAMGRFAEAVRLANNVTSYQQLEIKYRS